MYQLIRKTDQLLEILATRKRAHKGLVPTMGNLHMGHISLLERSLKENDLTIISIFVNPLQFGPNEDFEKYPRTLEDDCQSIGGLLQKLSMEHKEVIIYAPMTIEEVFPPGFKTRISVSDWTNKLCGKVRPGHFDGVTTVVYRLFSLTQPTNAYFGEKDFQQYLVIKKMVADLLLPINIIPMPIVRDRDGLALSSRNRFLSEQERKNALFLPSSILQLRTVFQTGLYKDQKDIADKIIQKRIGMAEWDYLEVVDADTLESPKDETKKILIAGAMKLGGTRLIDNATVTLSN